MRRQGFRRRRATGLPEDSTDGTSPSRRSPFPCDVHPGTRALARASAVLGQPAGGRQLGPVAASPGGLLGPAVASPGWRCRRLYPASDSRTPAPASPRSSARGSSSRSSTRAQMKVCMRAACSLHLALEVVILHCA